MYSRPVPRLIPQHRFHDLIEAASAVFLEQGYRRTQMADVAARMGIAKGTVYLYVESKEALFDAVLRHSDARAAIELPDRLPIPTPTAHETLETVRKRIADEAALPALASALARHRVTNVRAELRSIALELYDTLARNRIGIKLLDRCALDFPDLAAAWFEAGRIGTLALVQRYLEDRVRRGRIPPVIDAALAARMLLETLVFWAVHRHWDPSPQVIDEPLARQAVIEYVMRAILGAP